MLSENGKGPDPKTTMLIVLIGILIGGVAIYFATTFLPPKKDKDSSPPKARGNGDIAQTTEKEPKTDPDTEDFKEKTKQQNSLQLSSSDFSQNGIIPPKHTCESSKNVIPNLRIENVPPKTHSFAILLTKKSNSKVLWGVYDIDHDQLTIKGEKFIKGGKMIKTEFGTSYMGPCPSKEQKYAFTLYALDNNAKLPTNHPISPEKLKEVMEGHIIAKTALEASFTRQP